MKETLTISQIIAEIKRLDTILKEERSRLDLVRFYRKDEPNIGGRTIKEHTEKMKADLQSYIDTQKRLFALKSALSKANRETTLRVPAQPILAAILSQIIDDNETEEITIAEAINRKIFFKNTLLEEAKALMVKFSRNMSEKEVLDRIVAEDVNNALNRKFPPDMRNNWSIEKWNEEKKKHMEDAEVIRIDPCRIVDTDAITKYSNAVSKYLSDIDVLLSQINAITRVDIEY